MVKSTTILFCKNDVLLFENYTTLIASKTYDMFFKCNYPIEWLIICILIIATSSVFILMIFLAYYIFDVNSRSKF